MKTEHSKSERLDQETGHGRLEGASGQRRPYEPPHLIAFGHVRELTAGKNPGITDITSAGSIA